MNQRDKEDFNQRNKKELKDYRKKMKVNKGDWHIFVS